MLSTLFNFFSVLIDLSVVCVQQTFIIAANTSIIQCIDNKSDLRCDLCATPVDAF